MAITEARRFEMHLELKKRLGDDVADTLMEHLPPGGWDDVVRRGEIEQLGRLVDVRFANVDARLKGLVFGVWAMATVFSACFIALFTILATRL